MEGSKKWSITGISNVFSIYVNDMTEGLSNYISLFGEDAKLLRNHKNCEELHNYINKIYEWSRTWEMKFNAKKCHVLEMGKSAIRPSWTYKLLYQ